MSNQRELFTQAYNQAFETIQDAYADGVDVVPVEVFEQAAADVGVAEVNKEVFLEFAKGFFFGDTTSVVW